MSTANISTEDIKSLRDQTGISIMQCKKALEEAGGDREKALMVLRKLSAKAASKKADRSLGSGIVQSYIHGNNRVGVLVELLCETDFVANNEEFKSLASDIALHVAAMAPEFMRIEDIPAEERERVQAFMTEEAAGMDKPEDVKAKIIEGKVNDYFAERTLLMQSFVKDPSMTIGGLIDGAIQKIGEKIEIGNLARYAID